MDGILKSNSKYLVIKNKNKVVKYDLRGKEKLNNEYLRINDLIKNDEFYREHLVPACNFSKSEIFIFSDVYSYEMPYIKGDSFSKIIRNNSISIKNKKYYFDHLWNKFLNESVKKKPKHKVKKILWKNKLKSISKNISDIHYLSNLLYTKIVINGNEISNPKKLLTDFFEYKSKSYDGYNCVHGNFHSENIIIPFDKKVENFKIIDPDCNLKDTDSFFSLARFLYSYVHDTVENNKFSISTNMVTNKPYNFTINYYWKKLVLNSYALFENLIIEKGKNFATDHNTNQLLKSFISCLLIGINANENGIQITKEDNNRYISKSNSLFIFLKALNYVNYFMKESDKFDKQA